MRAALLAPIARPSVRRLRLLPSLPSPTSTGYARTPPAATTATRAPLASFAASPAQSSRARSPTNRRSRGFAMQGQRFPSQQQESQPGREYAMDPRPEAITQHYKSANKLQGKVAIVTDGYSIIRRAVCLCFALEGATVAFTYVKRHVDKDAEVTLQALRDIKGRTGARDPMTVPVDLGYEENCRKVVEEVASAYGGRVDVLVNNAAEQYERLCITDITEEDLERVFRSNIFSYVFVSKHALKHMGRGGSIINTSSINAYKGNKTLMDYTVTKGAIVAFTRALALQLVEKGIRVNPSQNMYSSQLILNPTIQIEEQQVKNTLTEFEPDQMMFDALIDDLMKTA